MISDEGDEDDGGALAHLWSRVYVVVVFGPAIARLRSAKYLSLSLKRQGILAALQASHFASGDGCRHLIFLRRLGEMDEPGTRRGMEGGRTSYHKR